MAKLHMVSLLEPPAFLPPHITTESSMRAEGREAEARYGSRAKRGAAQLSKVRQEATQRTQRDTQKEESRSAKLVAAQELRGGVIFSGVGDDGQPIKRVMEPGERLSWNHILGMGDAMKEWVDRVWKNDAELRWTAQALERQIILINSIEKDSALLRELKQVTMFQSRCNPIFGKGGNRQLSSTSGSRNDKLARVLQYVWAEGRSMKDTADDAGEEGKRWVTLTEREISELARKPVKARVGAGGAKGAHSPSLEDQIRDAGEEATAHETQLLQMLADKDQVRPPNIFSAMESAATPPPPPPPHPDATMTGTSATNSRGGTKRRTRRSASRTGDKGKEAALG